MQFKQDFIAHLIKVYKNDQNENETKKIEYG